MIGLNEQQRQAVEHVDGPLLIVAGAGTGKTRVIVEKAGYLLQNVPGLQPENILALTFSDKAAGEMKRRAAERWEEARHCRFSTFHSFCYQLLSEEADWKAMDEIDHWIFLRRNLESLDLDHYLHVSEPGRFLSDLLEFCSRCQDNLVTPEIYARYVEDLAAGLLSASGTPPEVKKKNKAKSGFSPEEEIAQKREVARVFARSEELQESAGLVSFGGMITRAAEMLAASPELLARLQRRYRYILVDEFQDTNWAQIKILQMMAGENGNLAVVGDPNQAIYHFRGASYTSFRQFEELYPRHVRVELSDNYRSTKPILALAKLATTFAPSDSNQPATQPLRAAKKKPDGRNVEVWEFISEDEQAEFLAREITRQVKTKEAKSFSDFAVLYRKHRHRDLLVAALRRNTVPFAIRKLAINDYPAVRDMIACLRAIGDQGDNVSLLRVMKQPRWQMEPSLLLELCRTARGQRKALSEVLKMKVATQTETERSPNGQGLRMLAEFLDRYQKISGEQHIGDWLDPLRQEMILFQQPDEEPRWRAFSEFVLKWEREKSATGLLGEFLEYFAYFGEAGGTINLPDEDEEMPAEENNNGQSVPAPLQGSLWTQQPAPDPLGKVQLMTMHAAKGLEFERVFLLHLLRGALPSRRQSPLISFPDALVKGPKPKGDVHTEEERRLFYVALTRARSTLTLCTISNDRQHPSVFLEELRKSNSPDLEWKPRAPCGADLHSENAASHSPAVGTPDAESLALSDSGIETYLLCPLKYYYSHVWQIPVTPSAALRFGSMMHGAVKQIVSRLAHRPETMEAAAIEDILREHWSPAAFTDPVQERKYWARGLEQLQGVWRQLSAKPFELLSQEKTFQYICGGIKVTGRIDQINRIVGKNVELIEYKTGRAQTQKDADRSRQLTIYAQACREVLGLEPVAVVLYNLENQEGIRTQRSSEDFLGLQKELLDAGSNIVAGRFPARPGFHCRYCDFRPICPAYEDAS